MAKGIYFTLFVRPVFLFSLFVVFRFRAGNDPGLFCPCVRNARHLLNLNLGARYRIFAARQMLGNPFPNPATLGDAGIVIGA